MSMQSKTAQLQIQLRWWSLTVEEWLPRTCKHSWWTTTTVCSNPSVFITKASWADECAAHGQWVVNEVPEVLELDEPLVSWKPISKSGSRLKLHSQRQHNRVGPGRSPS